MKREQLEFVLPKTIFGAKSSHRGRYSLRADWWFSRMRDVVNQAADPVLSSAIVEVDSARSEGGPAERFFEM